MSALSVLGLSPLGTATAQAEGYGVPGAIPTVANNPIDLSYGQLAQEYGATGAMGSNIAVFPDVQSGVNAANAQYGAIEDGSSNNYTPNTTLAEYAQTFAGGGSDSTNMLNNLEQILGAGPNDSIGTYLNGSSSSPADGSESPFSLQGIKDLWNGMLGTESVAGLPVANSSGQILNAPNPNSPPWTAARIAAIILGLIFLGIGAAMFKPVSKIIINSAKAAKTTSEVAAA